jgi:hypothetical protein
MRDADEKDRIGAGDEWYLYLPSNEEPVQPYRTAHTVWPLGTEELSRTESQAQSGNAPALNNLGTAQNSQLAFAPSNVCPFCAQPSVLHSDRGDASVRLGSAARQSLQSVRLLLPRTQRRLCGRHPQPSGVQISGVLLQRAQQRSCGSARRHLRARSLAIDGSGQFVSALCLFMATCDTICCALLSDQSSFDVEYEPWIRASVAVGCAVLASAL